MSIILSALAAAGDAGVQSMNQNIEQQNRLDIDNQRAALETNKAKVLAQFQHDFHNAPTNRAGDLIRASAAQPVPVAPAPVTQISGDDPNSAFNQGGGENADGKGLDPSQTPDLIARISQMPDSDPNKAGMLAQLQGQLASQKQAAIDAVAGKTRAPTSMESMSAALNKAIDSGDLQAAAAIKAAMPDKTITLNDGATLLDAATHQPIFSNTGKADRQDKQIAAQMELETKKENSRQALEGRKEAHQNAMKERELDPLGLNGGSLGVGTPVGGSMGKSNAAVQLGPVAQAVKDGLHGDDLLAAAPTQVAAQVKALAEGRMAFPAGFAMKTPYWQEMMTLVSQYDPSFDGANFNKRSQTATAFSKGKQADAVRAANQTIAHMGSLYDTIDSLNNFNGAATPLNYIVNPVEGLFGDARQGTFKMQAQAVASELRKVFSGSGGGSLQELKSWEESLPVNASQTQQKTYLQMGSHLLQGAIDALDNQYHQGMGTIADRMPLISPKAQAMLNKIQGNPDQSTVPAVGASGQSGAIDFGSLK